MEAQIAAFWYARGQRELQSGSVNQAIESFRKAVAEDREHSKYAFALANALAAANYDQEAMQTILRLREFDPENAEINLTLARLAAKHGVVTESLNYYEDAIYGRWSGIQVDERRRQARLELIRFLMAHDERERALSELMILDSDLSGTAAAHDQAGDLFLQLGDAPHALNDFNQALKQNLHDSAALTGAGKAYFQIGNYLKARDYLEAAVSKNPGSQNVRQLLSLIRMIFSNDPLANQITLKERRQRLFAAFNEALQRLQNCLQKPENGNGTANLQTLASDAEAIRSRLEIPSIRRKPEMVRSDLDFIYRMEQASNAACGEATGTDEALVLIAKKHGVE
jgi:tetratricopeptide (TPR) repeat protein